MKWNTRMVMSGSALVLSIGGFGLLFLPEEILQSLGVSDVHPVSLFFTQLLGCVYLSLAVLNWLARGNVIGGIYSKPVAMANFGHFFLGAITVLRSVLDMDPVPGAFWLMMVVYPGFAVLFGLVAFGKFSREQ